MGNFVYLPGSHRTQVVAHYDTHDHAPEEHILCVKRGTMPIMHCNAYCPSWICEADRHQNSKMWLDSPNREQRIIMRSYESGYARTKPPASCFFPVLESRYGERRR